jgi:hypothetical protein
MNSIEIAQQVIWFLEGGLPVGIAALGIFMLTHKE